METAISVPEVTSVDSLVNRSRRLMMRSEAPLPAPRVVLESIVNDRCAGRRHYVMFSGGRDSSAVLALCVMLARRRGDPDPIPVILRHPGLREADETDWQEIVLDHLSVANPVVINVSARQRLLGESALRTIRRRGVVWPAALQLREVAYGGLLRGSILLTGEGGDHMFGGRRIAALRNLASGGQRPSRYDLRECVASVTPSCLRARNIVPPQWLRERAQAAYVRAIRPLYGEPISWRKSTMWMFTPRTQSVVLHNHLAAVREYGLEPVNPFTDPGFVLSLSRAGGFWGYADRTTVMRALFSDLLPDSVLSRSTKASFNGSRWGEYERTFAQEWDGSGVDTELIDVERLREEWLSDRPGPGADYQIQLAWAAREGIATPLAPG